MANIYSRKKKLSAEQCPPHSTRTLSQPSESNQTSESSAVIILQDLNLDLDAEEDVMPGRTEEPSLAMDESHSPLESTQLDTDSHLNNETENQTCCFKAAL